MFIEISTLVFNSRVWHRGLVDGSRLARAEYNDEAMFGMVKPAKHQRMACAGVRSGFVSSAWPKLRRCRQRLAAWATSAPKGAR